MRRLILRILSLDVKKIKTFWPQKCFFFTYAMRVCVEPGIKTCNTSEAFLICKKHFSLFRMKVGINKFGILKATKLEQCKVNCRASAVRLFALMVSAVLTADVVQKQIFLDKPYSQSFCVEQGETKCSTWNLYKLICWSVSSAYPFFSLKLCQRC